MAFLDHRPLVPGHCLVIPKAHHVTIADLPAAVITPLFASVQRVARAVEAGMEADGTFVAINNRVSQSVSHLHVHIVPRRFKDGLFTANFVWKRRPYPDEAAAEATRRAIQEALERLTTANESAPISR